MKDYSVSLVIPAFNEEESILGAINISENQLRMLTRAYELIIVNDGSTDKTGEIIDDCAKRNSRIKVIHNKKREGSGKSLFIGLKEARYGFIVTNFADLPFDLQDLAQILLVFDKEEVDFIVVVRKDRKANSLYRKITSLANYWLIRTLFNLKVGDFQFVQIYRKKVIDAVDVNSRGTFVPPEIIIKAMAYGFKMQEHPAFFHPRKAGRSKCGNPGVTLQTLSEMMLFWFRWNIYLKIFLFLLCFLGGMQ